ncbi:hypothetical protein QO226_22705, partial [Vibrio vulnificus]|nr:hypothetical protein [Vibrio vulnificus]
YFYFQLSQILLTVAFVMLLSLMATSDKAGKTSLFFVISNVLGGLLAFAAFVTISLVPNMYIYMLVMLVVITLLGTKIYKKQKVLSPLLSYGNQRCLSYWSVISSL